MALSCGTKCAKGILITFNLFFWLSGCALIAFGIFILIEEEKSTLFPLFRGEENYADLQKLAFGFIGIGGLVFIVGFFGCFGAMQENKCMLVTYFIFLFIILAAELSVGILAIYYQNKNEVEMEGFLKESLKKRYGVDPHTTKAMDLAQTKFHCCGIKDPSDYADSYWIKTEGGGKSVTPTCCVLRNAAESTAYLNPQPINETLCQREDASNLKFRHQNGCLDKLKDFIREESKFFIGIGCGIAALEVFRKPFARGNIFRVIRRSGAWGSSWPFNGSILCDLSIDEDIVNLNTLDLRVLFGLARELRKFKIFGMIYAICLCKRI